MLLHLYSGQLDLVVPYPGTVELMANLDWDGAEEYRLPTINLIMFSNLKNCNVVKVALCCEPFLGSSYIVQYSGTLN